MAQDQHLWTTCRQSLRPQLADAVWRSTFQDVTQLGVDEESLRLAVPSAVVKDRIENRYLPLVEGVVRDLGGSDRTVFLEVRPGAGERAPVADPLDAMFPRPSVVAEAGPPPPSAPPVTPAAMPDQPSRTFDDFVRGPSNRFAYAAAFAVAETPGRSYNPLFIYGDAGVGKTHLLHSIKHYVEENYPHYIVRYVPTEIFLNEFIEAIRLTKMPEFKRRYRDVNVLLVDDIQFLETRMETQQEFFHTFNALHEGRRQLVLSSDRPPDAISTLESRLRSRFKMGLITDIQPPDLETRIAILRQKARDEPVRVPDNVLEFIATNITDNIRELEGALNRVVALGKLVNQPLNLGEAEAHLHDILSDQPKPITPQLIMETTSAMFNVTIEDLTGKSRLRPLVTARQIAMYVFRDLTEMSYPAIAREFGGRDHTTVIHAVEKITKLMGEQRQILNQVSELIAQVRKGG